MDHAALVRGCQPFEQAARDRERAVERHLADAVAIALQRLAVDVIHADEPATAGFGDVVDAHDVRARYLPREQKLPAKALERVGFARELGPQQLQCDIDVEREIARAVDDAHAADAEQRDDLKAAEQVARSELGARDLSGHRRGAMRGAGPAQDGVAAHGCAR